jgi:enoyl-[acyl-carrier protein] reductase III
MALSKPAQRRSEGLPLAAKVALITGASRGIGRAIALKLAAAGCDIAANYYNAHDEAENLCGEVVAMGRRAIAIQGNVADPESTEEVFKQFREHFDHLDILVSNAASGVLRPLESMTLKHWRWCMETNALALVLFAQRAISLMPHGGRIVAISSLGSQRAMPDYGFIGASKAALEALVRALAYELAPRGVRVNAISAGVVDTDALKMFPAAKQIASRFKKRAPVGRLLKPEDVAGAVYLLCLPEAEMINGQTVIVDGGFSIAE